MLRYHIQPFSILKCTVGMAIFIGILKEIKKLLRNDSCCSIYIKQENKRDNNEIIAMKEFLDICIISCCIRQTVYSRETKPSKMYHLL